MKINFTKKQYKNLIELIHLGKWMINAHRTHDRVKKYEELEQYIFSFYKDFGMEQYIVFDEELKRFFPTIAFEGNIDVERYKNEYDNDTFWDQLIYRMARRDFLRAYGEAVVRKMTIEELIEKEQPFIEKYENEFEKNGLENLAVKL